MFFFSRSSSSFLYMPFIIMYTNMYTIFRSVRILFSAVYSMLFSTIGIDVYCTLYTFPIYTFCHFISYFLSRKTPRAHYMPRVRVLSLSLFLVLFRIYQHPEKLDVAPFAVFVRSRSGGTRTSMFDFFPPKWSGALTSNFCAFLPFLRQGAFARRSTIVYTRLVIPLYHSFSIFRLSFPLRSFRSLWHTVYRTPCFFVSKPNRTILKFLYISHKSLLLSSVTLRF
jgi:hypothetical protein